MAKAKKKVAPQKRAKKAIKFPPDHFVEVKNKGYGKGLQGIKIHYEGQKPSTLKADGSITFGKHILELLTKTFTKFQWIITPSTDSIEYKYGIHRVRTSVRTLSRMYQELFSRSKDIKVDILSDFFSIAYPGQFKAKTTSSYSGGSLAKIIKPEIVSKMSPEDKDALNSFLPGYIAQESYSTVNLLKANAQIQTLEELAEGFKLEIGKGRSESWWQDYIKANILIIQQGYIKAIEKLNVALGGTKYPDFLLITHDSYIDILEIKKPSTVLLKHDSGRDNYHWDVEMSRAIIQTENYIEQVSSSADKIRSFIKDKYKIDLKIVRPRGIILAGDTSTFENQKQKDDFRLLTQAHKNILFVTYDEMLNRLNNYISVLKEFSAPEKKTATIPLVKKVNKKAVNTKRSGSPSKARE